MYASGHYACHPKRAPRVILPDSPGDAACRRSVARHPELPARDRFPTGFADNARRSSKHAPSDRRRGGVVSTGELFLGPRLAEGRRDFLLLDARFRVAALPEVLLFGAVTHHAGISHLGSLLGLGAGFLRHA